MTEGTAGGRTTGQEALRKEPPRLRTRASAVGVTAGCWDWRGDCTHAAGDCTPLVLHNTRSHWSQNYLHNLNPSFPVPVLKPQWATVDKSLFANKRLNPLPDGKYAFKSALMLASLMPTAQALTTKSA